MTWTGPCISPAATIRRATTSRTSPVFGGRRACDIARFIGADTTLPDDLVRGLWDWIAPEAEKWRQMGVFGAAVDVPEDAPLQDRLLGLTGWQPR